MQAWSFSIGDNSLIGWLITFGYFLAAGSCIRAARRAAEAEASFWFWAGVALLLLGLNKQLDLHAILIQEARGWARTGGWYQDRRTYQALFILLLLLAGIAGMTMLVRRFRGSSGALKAGIVGLGFTILFLLIRAASFHHADQLLRTDLGGVRAHALLESIGIITVALAARAYAKHHGSMRR
jgi:hypothetical protein